MSSTNELKRTSVSFALVVLLCLLTLALQKNKESNPLPVQPDIHAHASGIVISE